MGKEHQVSFRQHIEGEFHCPRCLTMARVRYLAKGTGAWAREGLFGDASSAQEQSAHSAAMELSRDSEVVKSYLRCPACHMRAPSAFMWTRIGIVLCVVLGATGWWGLGSEDGKWGAIGLAGLAIYLVIRAGARRGRADEAAFSMVEKGPDVAGVVARKGKPAPVTKPASLPRARIASGTAPKLAAPARIAPVVPVRTSAPEIVEARDAGEGPAFLK